MLHVAQRDEEPEDGAALVLRLERAADIAERARLAREHAGQRAQEHPIEVLRLSGEKILQGGQIRTVFDRVHAALLSALDHI